MENPEYYTLQGSVILNGQVWNYNAHTGQWVKNEWASSCSPPFGSSTQCVTPLEHSSSTNPVTGAVNSDGHIPLAQDQLIYIQVPGGAYPMELLVNTRDECPGCVALQVDVLSTNPYGQYSYNTPAGIQTQVYIWAAIPIPTPKATGYE